MIVLNIVLSVKINNHTYGIMDDFFRAWSPYIITPLNICIQFGFGTLFWLNIISYYLTKLYLKIRKYVRKNT